MNILRFCNLYISARMQRFQFYSRVKPTKSNMQATLHKPLYKLPIHFTRMYRWYTYVYVLQILHEVYTFRRFSNKLTRTKHIIIIDDHNPKISWYIYNSTEEKYFRLSSNTNDLILINYTKNTNIMKVNQIIK